MRRPPEELHRVPGGLSGGESPYPGVRDLGFRVVGWGFRTTPMMSAFGWKLAAPTRDVGTPLA